MEMNVTLPEVSEKIAAVLQGVSSPARLSILIALGQSEACVCHLESILGWRQAYISQHLMALRKANLLLDRREGRYVFYRLKDAATLDLVRDAAVLGGLDPHSLDVLIDPRPAAPCACPHCAPQPDFIVAGSL